MRVCVCVLTQQGVGCHRDQATDKLVYDTLPRCDLPSKISVCIMILPVMALFLSVHAASVIVLLFGSSQNLSTEIRWTEHVMTAIFRGSKMSFLSNL